MPSYAIAPAVSTEKFEDEVMVVDLESGNYFSLTGTGARIWNLLEDGHTASAIAAQLAGGYRGDPEDMRSCLERFISELESEKLISGAAEDGPDEKPGPSARPASDAPEFEPPVLEKYTDMQELLLIDPIHEVSDEHGWPKMDPDRED